MAILFNNAGGETQEWVKAFAEYLPNMPLQVFPDVAPEQIKYAVTWNHPPGDLKRYSNLRAIMNLGAGTDYLDADPELPRVPVVRLLDPVVGVNMAQYVLYWAMHFHRGYGLYTTQQIQAKWSRFQVPQVSEFRIGILGLGLIGQEIASYIANSGFACKAWNRSRKDIPGADCFTGEVQLSNMLAQTDVLVNCLPLNGDTKGLLDQTRFEQMPKGGWFINVSRGGVVSDNGLLSVLDSGHLSGATLDCFAVEPLVANSPYWSHPKVQVTPHISGATYADTSARVVADNILRMENGEQPFPIYSQFPY